MDFVDWLNKELNERGWSNSELAKRSGMAPSTISMIISRQSKPGWDFCAGLAKALGESPDKLFRLAGLLPPLPDPAKTEPDQAAMIREIYQVLKQSLSHMLIDTRANYQVGEVPPAPAVPDSEHIMELFQALDQARKQQVYAFTRWLLKEQLDPANSSGQRKKSARQKAIEDINLYLAVNKATPAELERLIIDLIGINELSTGE
jgi:transcriptional regulator with XRE-family HTH domain